MTIKLYYWGGYNNFGDELSPYIIRSMTGQQVCKASESDDKPLVAIGSILDNSLLTRRATIWGSGTLARKKLLPPPPPVPNK